MFGYAEFETGWWHERHCRATSRWPTARAPCSGVTPLLRYLAAPVRVVIPFVPYPAAPERQVASQGGRQKPPAACFFHDGEIFLQAAA